MLLDSVEKSVKYTSRGRVLDNNSKINSPRGRNIHPRQTHIQKVLLNEPYKNLAKFSVFNKLAIRNLTDNDNNRYSSGQDVVKDRQAQET